MRTYMPAGYNVTRAVEFFRLDLEIMSL